MNKKHVISLSLATALLLLVGCGEEQPTPEDPALTYTEFAANVERDLEPNINSADFEQFITGNNQFALSAYQKSLDESAGGQIISPLSLRTALAMIYAGAEGDTKAEMADALSFDLTDESLHAGFNRLLATLDLRNLPSDEQYPAQELSIVNAIWPQLGTQPAEEFLEVLAKNYGKGVYALDYAQNAEAARQAINDQIYDWTKGHIEDLLPENSVPSDTQLVLTSTIYLYAPWNIPFFKSYTEPRAFHNLDGTSVEVDTMRGDIPFRYGTHNGADVLALSFRQSALEMVMLVPPHGEFTGYISQLDEEGLSDALAGLTQSRAYVEMPKFELNHTMSAMDALKSMGMQQAFSRNAEFDAIGLGSIFISTLAHQAFIKVDEDGAEAAAATAIVTLPVSAPQFEIKVDRPFVFIIRDTATGAYLFIGHVANL